MRRTFRIGLISGWLLLGGGAVMAAGGGGGDSSSVAEDPDWKAAVAAIEARDYSAALPLLQKVVAGDPDKADAWNYLGYAKGQLGQYDQALADYGRALAIEPKHRGANEYLGELHLKMGNLAAAEDRLKVLDGACFFGCAEYDELKAAIATYKTSGRYEGRKLN